MPPTRRVLLAALLSPLPPWPHSARAGGEPADEAASAAAFSGESFAADPHTGLALGGFDPVTYFLGDPANPAPRPGRPAIELGHAGAVWRFAGDANRAAFRADPDTYTPRLHGYDAVGAARGRLVDADPLVAARLGGRLYLFRSLEGRERALREPGLVTEAETRWPSLRP